MRRFALAVALVVVSSALVPAQQPAPKTVALLVGVNEYDSRGLDSLKFAENDANDLADELRARGFSVFVLTGSSIGNSRATKKNIEQALLNKVLTGRTKDDVVLVALAGHGLQFQ